MLIGDKTIRLQDAQGLTIFDLTRDQITKVRIQQQYIYINVGRKLYTLGVMPEVMYRKSIHDDRVRLNTSIDAVTKEWHDFLKASTDPTGTTSPIKVTRMSAAGLAVLMGVLFLFTNVLNRTTKQDEPTTTKIQSSQVQLPAGDAAPEVGSYVLSGYSTTALYTNRTPDFDDTVSYPTYEAALKAGEDWQTAKGSDATVEIIQLVSETSAKVIAVYDKNGLEVIKY